MYGLICPADLDGDGHFCRMMESTPLLASAQTLRKRRRALKERGVGKAAHLIKDAVFGHQDAPYEGYYDPYQNEQSTLRNNISVVCGRLVVQLRGAVTFFSWALFLLTFFEPPHWCRDASDLQIVAGEAADNPSYDISESVNAYGDCELLFDAVGTTADGEEDQSFYPNSSTMLLSVYQSTAGEMVCVVFIALYMALAFADDGFELQYFFYRGFKRWTHTLQCILIGCILLGNVCDATRYNPFFRMLMLATYHRTFRREFWTFLKIFPGMLLPFSMLAIIVVFWAWFGVVIFYDSKQGLSAFPNLPEAMWTLWIAVTTANYPDFMMPSYNANRVAALFGVSFMVLTFFFVMNLILAVAVNSYDKSIEERKSSRRKMTHSLLSEAFSLLDHQNNNFVSRESIMHVMTIINQDVAEIRGISEDEKSILFAFLDKDGDNAICREEFMQFGQVLLLKLSRKSDYATQMETRFPRLYRSSAWQATCTIVKSKRMDHIIEAVLVMNAVVIGLQDYPMLSGQDVSQDPHYAFGYLDTVYEDAETFFTTVYVLEATVKLLVHGWRGYFESPRNAFDFVITCLVVLATAYVYYPNGYSDHTLVEFVVMVRVLRLGRLLFAVERFRMFGSISLEIIPAATSVFMVLLFISYFFGSLGMLLFGGDITRDPNNPKAALLLEAEDFVDNEYYANNFNDMLSSMQVLFNWLVVNNWPQQTEGMIYTSGEKWLVRLFFLSFYILGVIGVSNVITSFIINAFFQQLATIEQRHGPEEDIAGEAKLKGSRAVFDPSTVTGTETGLSHSVYFARIGTKHDDVELDEREALRRLFSRTSTSVSDSER